MLQWSWRGSRIPILCLFQLSVWMDACLNGRAPRPELDSVCGLLYQTPRREKHVDSEQPHSAMWASRGLGCMLNVINIRRSNWNNLTWFLQPARYDLHKCKLKRCPEGIGCFGGVYSRCIFVFGFWEEIMRRTVENRSMTPLCCGFNFQMCWKWKKKFILIEFKCVSSEGSTFLSPTSVCLQMSRCSRT